MKIFYSVNHNNGQIVTVRFEDKNDIFLNNNESKIVRF